MKLISLFMLVIWSFFGMAGVNGVQSCQPVSEVNSADYKFDVILIKKGEKAEIGPIQSLDLSVYRGKIVLLSIFSSKCGWCLADLLYHSSFQKEWPKELSVVMVNLSFGPLPDEMADKRYFDSSPQEMLDFVTTAYKKTRYKERIDLKNVDFYHIVDTPQTKETAFGAIKTFVSSDQTILFPGLIGTPYSVIIDEEGKIHFRGHFTSGKGEVKAKYGRHYNFITSLASKSCNEIWIDEF